MAIHDSHGARYIIGGYLFVIWLFLAGIQFSFIFIPGYVGWLKREWKLRKYPWGEKVYLDDKLITTVGVSVVLLFFSFGIGLVLFGSVRQLMRGDPSALNRLILETGSDDINRNIKKINELPHMRKEYLVQSSAPLFMHTSTNSETSVLARRGSVAYPIRDIRHDFGIKNGFIPCIVLQDNTIYRGWIPVNAVTNDLSDTQRREASYKIMKAIFFSRARFEHLIVEIVLASLISFVVYILFTDVVEHYVGTLAMVLGMAIPMTKWMMTEVDTLPMGFIAVDCLYVGGVTAGLLEMFIVTKARGRWEKHGERVIKEIGYHLRSIVDAIRYGTATPQTDFDQIIENIHGLMKKDEITNSPCRLLKGIVPYLGIFSIVIAVSGLIYCIPVDNTVRDTILLFIRVVASLGFLVTLTIQLKKSTNDFVNYFPKINPVRREGYLEIILPFGQDFDEHVDIQNRKIQNELERIRNIAIIFGWVFGGSGILLLSANISNSKLEGIVNPFLDTITHRPNTISPEHLTVLGVVSIFVVIWRRVHFLHDRRSILLLISEIRLTKKT